MLSTCFIKVFCKSASLTSCYLFKKKHKHCSRVPRVSDVTRFHLGVFLHVHVYINVWGHGPHCWRATSAELLVLPMDQWACAIVMRLPAPASHVSELSDFSETCTWWSPDPDCSHGHVCSFTLLDSYFWINLFFVSIDFQVCKCIIDDLLESKEGALLWSVLGSNGVHVPALHI